jgi:hypothetical protein
MIDYICSLMKKSGSLYSVFHKLSAICMILALVWLTVSTPFIFRVQQDLVKSEKSTGSNPANSPGDEEVANPFSNSTEEKAPTSVSTISEYLHETETLIHPSGTLAKHHKYHVFDCYIAFHGELLSPPPEA